MGGAVDFGLRIMEMHPVKCRNERSRRLRCTSHWRPEGNNANENPQYTELKKWLPPSVIKRDVTARDARMILSVYGTEKIIEFKSVKQDIEAFAGTQIDANWEDEEVPKEIHDENMMRLLAKKGDHFTTCTPVNKLTWLYDDAYMKARRIFRTDTVVKATGLPKEETYEGRQSIDCFQWASDDNPTLDPAWIEEKIASLGDPDLMLLRRYGVFTQITGAVYKGFDAHIHAATPFRLLFPKGLPEWRKAQVIDLHEHNPWAITYLMFSPEDEWFVFRDHWLSVDRYQTEDVVKLCLSTEQENEEQIDWRLVDPLAEKTQLNTGRKIIDDLRHHGFGNLRGADHKNPRGRDVIRKRLTNAKTCGKPFNNVVKEPGGRTRRLPTIWFCPENAQHTIKAMKTWRMDEYLTMQARASHERFREKPQDKGGHFPRNLEYAAVDPRSKHYSRPALPQAKAFYGFQGTALGMR